MEEKLIEFSEQHELQCYIDKKKGSTINVGEISDGYHTFNELYEHRNRLFVAVAKLYQHKELGGPVCVWRSRKHSDGTEWDGWFLLGVRIEAGRQITYHLPDKYWDELYFSDTLEVAPEFDGHTSEDVLERLKTL